jgi:trk system potassium uptake protein TrkH
MSQSGQIPVAVAAAKTVRPEWLVMKTFLFLILAGAFLLMLPVSHPGGRWMDPVTALFTATSATCVTGLTVADPGTAFNLFGQLVILLLIQVGGLGLMTLGTFLLLVVSRKVSILDESATVQSLGLSGVAGLKKVLYKTIAFTILFEAAGTAILAWRFSGFHGMPVGRAVYMGLFHSVSSFCNAGFALFPDNLIGLRDDPWIVLTLAALLISGGLGFIVWHELTDIKFWRIKTLRGRLSLHTRLVLFSTGILIAVGFLGFLLLEWRNTLAPLSVPDRFVAAFFSGVTPRTAGYNVVDMGQVNPPTLFFTIGMMFIGAAPCSTAGGVKVTTIVVMVLTLVSMLRGRRDVGFAERTIPISALREALAIFVLSLALVLVVFGVLLLTEDLGRFVGRFGAPDALLFETVSAFGTVGLSTGITPHLTAWGQLTLVVMMFLGRLGPVTIASIIASQAVKQQIRYPEEYVLLG